LSKVTSELQNGVDNSAKGAIGSTDRKLSFFQPKVSTYAIPRSLQQTDPEKARFESLKILQTESRDLASYILAQYNQTLEIDPSSGAAIFPTQKRWLKGEEYGFLIRHYYAYSTLLNEYSCIDKEHPNSVYD